MAQRRSRSVLRRYVIGHELDATNTKGGLAEFFVDLSVLLRTRLLVQARSGGGKSYLIRRLLEQTHGAVQHLVIDVEGEFASLRERFDYVLAAKDGDTPADPRAARLLAERLLELKASAILDLYELKMPDRIRFVHLFLDALVNAPKHLWHPVLIVIDEAHIFCPQQDRSDNEAAGSVIDLLTRGRKRGFCAVLATQRLSKLHKDAAAECQNKMIGGTTLDVDQKRAADELGFSTKEDRIELRRLKPGQFFAYGAALSADVVKVQVGPVVTKHPKPGSRLTFKAPPPTQHIRMMLPKLADLPAEAEQREQTQRELKRELADGKAKIRTLEHEVTALKAAPPKVESVVDKKTVKNIEHVAKLVREVNLTQVRLNLDKLNDLLTDIRGSIDAATGRAKKMQADGAYSYSVSAVLKDGSTVPLSALQAGAGSVIGGAVTPSSNNADARILAALKQYGPSSASKVGARAGVSPNVSTFRLAVGRLRKAGLLTGDSDAMSLTKDGYAAAAAIPDLPTGRDALSHWRAKLGNDNLPRRIFEALIAAGAGGAPPLALTSNPTVSTFRLAIGKLKKLGIITGSKHRYFISEELAQ